LPFSIAEFENSPSKTSIAITRTIARLSRLNLLKVSRKTQLKIKNIIWKKRYNMGKVQTILKIG